MLRVRLEAGGGDRAQRRVSPSPPTFEGVGNFRVWILLNPPTSVRGGDSEGISRTPAPFTDASAGAGAATLRRLTRKTRNPQLHPHYPLCPSAVPALMETPRSTSSTPSGPRFSPSESFTFSSFWGAYTPPPQHTHFGAHLQDAPGPPRGKPSWEESASLQNSWRIDSQTTARLTDG